MTDDKTPSLAESITYMRAQLEKAYKENKHTEFMRYLSVLLWAAENSERLERENESLASYAYNITHGRTVALRGVESELLLLAKRVREIADGYSGRES